MSKPNAYTIQMTKKANGTLRMRLMVPGYETITMDAKEMRDVAAGIEAMFAKERTPLYLPKAEVAITWDGAASAAQANDLEGLERIVTQKDQESPSLACLRQCQQWQAHNQAGFEYSMSCCPGCFLRQSMTKTDRPDPQTAKENKAKHPARSDANKEQSLHEELQAKLREVLQRNI